MGGNFCFLEMHRGDALHPIVFHNNFSPKILGQGEGGGGGEREGGDLSLGGWFLNSGIKLVKLRYLVQ